MDVCLTQWNKFTIFPFFMFLFSIYAPDSFISLRFFLNLQILEKLFIFVITKVKKRRFLGRVMLFWLLGFDLSCICIFFDLSCICIFFDLSCICIFFDLSCICIFFDTVIFIVGFNRRFFDRYWIWKIVIFCLVSK